MHFYGTSINVTINHCMNNGRITAYNHIGGFIGGFWSNDNSNITILNSWNTNAIQSNEIGNNTGGFFGNIPGNSDSRVSIINCGNNGTINGGNIVGGFIGSYGWNKKLNYSYQQLHKQR